ncbi:MAG: polysaccharide biosynthesis/export family protein [Bacteroidota bacterium]
MSSCIGPKKLIYLQQDEDSEAAQDSLLTLQEVQKPYRVQVNDILSIRVKAIDQELVGMFNPIDDSNADATTEEKAYFDGYRIDRRGEIRIPTMGKLKVVGMTLEEIETLIEKELLESYFTEKANLFVTVKLPGIRYTTMGEIGSPGGQVVYKQQVSIMEALANSGDILMTGDRKNVKILRQYPEGKRIHHIDLTSIDAVNSPYYYIQPNDLILVNPLPQKSYGIGTDGFGTLATVLGLVSTVAILIWRFNR